MLTLRLVEMLMILLPSSGGKTQAGDDLLQKNQKLHPKSPESLLLEMMVPILVLRR
jgi:hypothetical protein